jgi:ABC-type nickel/cobalt efflux system permease component RcnA
MSDIELVLPGGLLVLGLLTGFRHSIEADHVAAISTIVTSDINCKGILRLSYIGILWGIGHTIALLVVGFIILILAINIPSEMTNVLEFIVGIMLIYLAITTITGLNISKFLRGIFVKNKGHNHPHIHIETNTIHSHLYTHNNKNHHHEHKSIIVGVIHGLAGSGALMLLILSTINSTEVGIMYIAIFGIGSIFSMTAISTIIGLPLMKIGKRSTRLKLAIKLSSSVFSIIIGISIMMGLITGSFI